MNVQELKARLINRSKNGLTNYSLLRENSNRIIDLYTLQKYFLIDDIIEQILTKNEVTLTPFHIKEEQLENEKLLQLKTEYLKNLTKELLVPNDFSNWLFQKQNNIKTKLDKIRKNDNFLIQESGITCLRLGFFFAQGKLKNFKNEDEVFRAPLFFLKIKINFLKAKGSINLTLDEDGFEINETFFERIAFLHKTKINYEFKNEIENIFNERNLDSIYIHKINSALNILRENIFKKFAIKIIESPDFKTEKIQKFPKPTMNKNNLAFEIKENNRFEIINSATIGIFKITSFEIINDLENWEKQDGNDWLLAMENINNINDFNKVPNKEKDFNEIDIVQINKLDFSQKMAILNALNKSMTIQGPPGTGKSQTIANLIVNIAFKNKTILFCAEKKVATDVVYKKLHNFKNICLEIHDVVGDKAFFYQQLESNYNFLTNSATPPTNTISNISNEIDEKFKIIKKYHEFTKSENYKIYLKIIRKYYCENNIRNIAQRLINFNVLNIYKLNQHSNFSDKTKLLLEQKLLFEFYEENKKYDFIFSNLEHLEQTLKFNVPITVPNVITDLAFQAINFNILKIYDFTNLNAIKPSLEFLQQQYLLFKFYEENKKYDFIFNNLEHLEQILKFNWKLIRNFKSFKKGIFYFLKNKKLKYRTSFLSLLFIKDIKKKYNDSSLKTTFSYLKTIKETDINNWYNLRKLINNNHLNEVKTIFSNINNETEIKFLIDCLFLAKYEVANNKSNLLKTTFSYLKTIKETAINNWYNLRKLINNNHLNEVKTIFSNINNETEIKALFENLYAISYENENEAILKTNTTIIKKAIKKLITAKIEASKDQLSTQISDKIKEKLRNYIFSSSEKPKKMNSFKTIIAKKRLSIKNLFKQYGDIIHIMTPILITSIEVAPIIIELKKHILDYTIFDEASQIYLENAIALLYRGKTNIVVGDSKQLAPTNFFNTSLDDDNEEETNEISTSFEDNAKDFTSLLEYSAIKFENAELKYHYRSEHKELIHFSNQMFYESKLILANPSNRSHTEKPIQAKSSNGIWDGQVNEIEANDIVKLINKTLANGKKESLGVITFNKKQSSLIKQKIDEEDNPLIKKAIEKKSDHLFIKNLEEVQGDERDVIILGISFAKNPNGKLSGNFGAISRNGGENRINVAVTRAKKKTIIIKSIMSKDVKVKDLKSSGGKAFCKYLEYIELLQHNNLESKEIKQLFLSNDIEEYTEQIQKTDSIFEVKVLTALSKVLNNERYHIESQVPQNGYKIDLAIWDKIIKKYILAIECDGEPYHSNWADKERDYYRQEFLEDKGWEFYRIPSHNWWKNKEQNQIISEIKNLIYEKEIILN